MSGICPNTNEMCPKLLEADIIRQPHIAAQPGGFRPNNQTPFGNDADRDLFNQNIREGFQKARLFGMAQKAGSCVSECVLEGIDVPVFLSADPAEQTA